MIASLDVDDVSSYGPETVTIVNARTDATYYYSVKDFTDRYDATSTKMSESGANVKGIPGICSCERVQCTSESGRLHLECI